MKITTRYTIQDWQTQEIEFHEIPEPVMELSFKQVLEIALVELGSVDLNPIELTFSCIFSHEEWNVIRTPMNRDTPVQQYISVAIERATGVREALYGSGVPDFFLWTPEGEHKFVEVKASEDSLNSNQKEWADNYDWNFAIAQLAPASERMSDEDILERNKIALY
ncbi:MULTISPECIES: VRR-NUC domain-containing protein [unclassified Halorubrum]|uniref:VRR-NUC domain-containing protein n=1 Tax=unclassified Halorubrum TaxID=2642239 RepID=UPI0003DB8759|nr:MULTISPECIES: VRR-NUC domain-containing protein [unclassified Halorubrum]CDK40104.1 hypothetical protein BN903_13 [Halorubrum sp. AJ67]